ncbi:hypothetical protein G6F47_001049 [Rhizopus delemar]|uniref:RTA1 like protein n=3 Tax=Rhizopus TaxID=4842 RepID=I1BGQ2_RHIO9|nr:hypothetical protein RO3G_00086 [Rhizopus delemar RA 99-880]KAG1057371.1 hypothetical protein G6F43_000776 [Rhizopus delemar]KAG1535852.1 hypothetical protein G6F51_011305 [Rhizopus arrhizus]KAG1564328.1 hypothetical protein G6F50_011130 [Rhizopus delemar]KAG1585579.1 hypothetical protein G6F48_007170 [Rhizopus delemar]|eukprot:EIE75382.1 hypothetical protein RO3G_00086 [Rhizopus delemar RA 99-880]
MDSSDTSGRPEGDRTLQIFGYIPNLPLCIVSLVVYLLFMLYLTYRIFKSKSRRFLYILPFTALMEVIGYILRALCHNFTSVGRYAIMQLLLLLAPNALALVNYKTVGEMIRLSNVDEKRFFLKYKFVTWFFFASDIFSFLMQGSGGGLQASGGESNANTGKAVTLVGLFIQLVFLACFAVITVYVHRNPRYVFHVEGVQNPKTKLVLCMYTTLVLLYIRSIYRVVEYADGYAGPVAKAEWAFYIFDTLAIAICFIFYILLFIGDYIPKRGAELIPTSSPTISMNRIQNKENWQQGV